MLLVSHTLVTVLVILAIIALLLWIVGHGRGRW